METITKYKAIDGKEFTDKDECIKYEILIERVNSIMKLIPESPRSSDFANGSGFIQHNPQSLKNVKISLLTICKEYIDHKWIDQTINDPTVDPSWVSRLLGDYGINPLYYAWNRFNCIDKDNREWGQPYFATHPEKAKNVCLNLI